MGTHQNRLRACGSRPNLAATSSTTFILEREDTLLSWDNQRLVVLTRAAGCRNTLRYAHQTAATEQLLALPGAIAWCWAKGGDWRRRIESVVTDRTNV